METGVETGMETGMEGNVEEEREDSGEHQAKRHKLSESTDPVNTEVSHIVYNCKMRVF